jgi:hypothetical protein
VGAGVRAGPMGGTPNLPIEKLSVVHSWDRCLAAIPILRCQKRGRPPPSDCLLILANVRYDFIAVASIMTFNPRGNAATPTVVRAGGSLVNIEAYASFIAGKSSMSPR